MKKLFMLILTLFQILLVSQNATPPDVGDGSSGNPYHITSLENLYWISAPDSVVPVPDTAARWSASYLQLNDVNASPTSQWNPDGSGGYYGWNPITSFSGSYDGDGFKIDSLYINRPASDNQGFFGLLFNGSTVKDLGLTSCDIKGRNRTGCLAGESIGTVTNCYAEGVLNASGGGGGLIGLNRTSITDCYASVSMEFPGGGLVNYNEGTITDCYSTGDISAYYANGPAGGLIAYNYGTITGCYSTGNAGCQWGSSVGGLAAENYSLIQNCYATGAVSGLNANGGLVGYNAGTNAVIEYSYAEGPVTDLQVSNWNSSGGLVGYNASGTIRNSYSRGNVALGLSNSGGTDYMAGFSGRNYQGVITDCYSTGMVSHNSDTGIGFTAHVDTGGSYEMSGNFWDIETSSQAATAGIAEPKMTSQMKTESTFTGAGWDFSDIWGISASINDGYPYFQWQYPAPDSPVGITIVYSSESPELFWTAVSGATSYKIYSSADPYADFSSWTLEATVTEPMWEDLNATEAKIFYVVVAVN